MKTIQSVDRTVTLLDTIAQHPGEYTLSELSRVLNLPVTTLHGFCATLEYWKLLQKNESGRFILGYRLFHYSLSFNAEQQLIASVHPYLVSLTRQFNETFHLGIVRDDKVIYIDKSEPSKPYRMTSVVGNMDEYYNSAIGMIVLAGRGSLIPAEHLKNCNDMQRDGYCLKFESEMDAYCLAVALLGNTAGINIVLPRHRYTPFLCQQIVDAMRAVDKALLEESRYPLSWSQNK
ncbi:MAG: helix-turn-helix domain-containing protein [Eubacteriales bacterium]|nr:helix-turn-helix domain-containing protein [Eubacteriales bacterium]